MAMLRSRFQWLTVLATLISLGCMAPRSFSCTGDFHRSVGSSKSFGLGRNSNGHPRPSLQARATSRDFGGERSQGLVTALVAAFSTAAMSLLQGFLHRTLWVPPFGAVALIFAAEAVEAAKQGTLLRRKPITDRMVKACLGVATACCCTVVAAYVFGDTPTMLRTAVMFWAAFSMTLNPGAGYFPPAGALCALYVERAVSKGALPGFEYALFPCATGVGLLLLFTRLFAFLVSRPVWALRSRFGQDQDVVLAKA